MSSATLPAAAPAYLPPAPPAGFGYPYVIAGVVDRGVAALIDMVILAAIALIVTVPIGLFSAAFLLTGATPPSYWELLWGPVALLTYGLWAAYFTYFESRYGQTLGKRALGLRVVNRRTGRPPDLGRSLVRNVLRVVDWLPALYLLGFLVAAISRERQRLGDLLAETLVVKA